MLLRIFIWKLYWLLIGFFTGKKVLEDYTALEDLVTHLREGDPLLKSIGDKFVTVGVS